MNALTRRRAALMIPAALLFSIKVAGAKAQTTHTGGGGRGGGGGHTPGGETDDHSHDEHDHEDQDHADGKRGPSYRGGRASTQVLGRGYGRSLEDRVLRSE